jgi:dephospho-CoA kinase
VFGLCIAGAYSRCFAQANPQGFDRLNAIVHPLVRQAQSSFLQRAAAAGPAALASVDRSTPAALAAPIPHIAVLDIPLLFETGGDKLVNRKSPSSLTVSQMFVSERKGTPLT